MENITILIVENESLVALELTETIKSFGYKKVSYATNSEMTKELIEKKIFDLILMDINLNEKIDGIELYESLNIDIPIIYLTAYKDDLTINKAILTNPLGYIIKPHNDDELRAIILLAQYKINSIKYKDKSEKLSLGDGYYFDIKEEKLFYHDIFIHLGKKELQLLKLLISARGNPVSYYRIEHEIWGSTNVNNSTLRTLIYRLRGKLTYKIINCETNYGVMLKPH